MEFNPYHGITRASTKSWFLTTPNLVCQRSRRENEHGVSQRGASSSPGCAADKNASYQAPGLRLQGMRLSRIRRARDGGYVARRKSRRPGAATAE